MNAYSKQAFPRKQEYVETNAGNFATDEKDLNKSPPKFINMQKIVDGASSASNAGIVYYKCLSEEMEKKINELQKAIEVAESTMNTQKQNIEDMINRKNQLLCDFHEQYRKFTRKTECETKMEDEIEQLIKFLDELMPLHNEISYVKTSEINIRNYVMEKYQTICNELQPVKDVYEKNVEQLQLTAEKLKEWKSQWEAYDKLNSDIKSAIRQHEEKLNHLKWSIKNEAADAELIKNEGERIQIQTNVEILEKQHILRNEAMKIQHTFHSLKDEFSKLKSEQNEFIRIKEQLSNYNEMFSKDNQKVVELDANIREKKLELVELQKKIEANSNHLHDLENKKRTKLEKQEQLCNILHEYKENITQEETKLNNLLEEERSIEGKMKQLSAEIEIQTEKRNTLLKKQQEERNALLEKQQSFSQEVTRKESLMKEINDLEHKKSSTKKNVLELNNELETKMKAINELKKNLFSNDILVKVNALEANALHSYLTVENECHVTSEFIDTELDPLLDQICKQESQIKDLEKQLKECAAEGLMLEKEVIEKENRLKNIADSIKTSDSAILALKQNVHQAKYITVQELNKQLVALTNHVKNEQNLVAKLKKEIEIGLQTQAATQESTKSKRRLLTPEKARNVASSTSKTARSKKKVEEPVDANKKKNQSDNDIYNFN
ncbi:repetitive organellar protein-like [Planococcus citri]|uniref:repetitive organellar protein-like n=1 Tax=Planococcus citri TaxID=170843 RepID=UPI0031F75AF4